MALVLRLSTLPSRHEICAMGLAGRCRTHDAFGMLLGAAWFRSKDAQMNRMLMELAPIAAPRGTTIEALHVGSAENHLDDTLSRLEDERLTLPPLLAKVPRTMAKDGDWRILSKK